MITEIDNLTIDAICGGNGLLLNPPLGVVLAAQALLDELAKQQTQVTE